MEAFGEYAKYYSLLYEDKDYFGEVEYVEKLIKEYAPEAETILDLGCGTGRHAQLLAEKKYNVIGIDASEDMLQLAKQIPSDLNLSFRHGDIRSLNLGNKYDVILSLFHVMSYQVNNSDLLSVFHTVHNHLNDSGVFIFDCWFGPAVLKNPPVVRVKRAEDDVYYIVRIAEPTMYPNKNIVEVNYELIIRNKANGVMSNILEKHTMRYLFIPEIDSYLSHTKLKMLTCEEWSTRKMPNFDSWNVLFVCAKNNLI